jgi:hypothetical protein
MNGYNLHATHIPKAASKKENKNKIPPTTRELHKKSEIAVIKIIRLKINPIRAAKILGPALISNSSNDSNCIIFRDEKPIGL